MLHHLRKAWRELKTAPPGRRFQARYERTRDSRRGMLRKWALVAGGALLALVGVVFLPLPGPGMLIIAAGALLIAQASRVAARMLDALELRVRRLVRREPSFPPRSR